MLVKGAAVGCYKHLWWLVNIGLDDGLLPSRQQVITWASVNPDLWHNGSTSYSVPSAQRKIHQTCVLVTGGFSAQNLGKKGKFSKGISLSCLANHLHPPWWSSSSHLDLPRRMGWRKRHCLKTTVNQSLLLTNFARWIVLRKHKIY